MGQSWQDATGGEAVVINVLRIKVRTIIHNAGDEYTAHIKYRGPMDREDYHACNIRGGRPYHLQRIQSMESYSEEQYYTFQGTRWSSGKENRNGDEEGA